MDGDSAWGLKAIRLATCGGSGSLVEPSGSRIAARAEKKPAPWGGRPTSLSDEVEEVMGWRAGDAGADGGPILEVWFTTCLTALLGATYDGRSPLSCGGRLSAAPLVALENPLLGVCGCGGTCYSEISIYIVRVKHLSSRIFGSIEL